MSWFQWTWSSLKLIVRFGCLKFPMFWDSEIQSIRKFCRAKTVNTENEGSRGRGPATLVSEVIWPKPWRTTNLDIWINVTRPASRAGTHHSRSKDQNRINFDPNTIAINSHCNHCIRCDSKLPNSHNIEPINPINPKKLLSSGVSSAVLQHLFFNERQSGRQVKAHEILRVWSFVIQWWLRAGPLLLCQWHLVRPIHCCKSAVTDFWIDCGVILVLRFFSEAACSNSSPKES